MQHTVSSIITLLVNVNINHVTHTVQRRTPVVFRTASKRHLHSRNHKVTCRNSNVCNTISRSLTGTQNVCCARTELSPKFVHTDKTGAESDVKVNYVRKTLIIKSSYSNTADTWRPSCKEQSACEVEQVTTSIGLLCILPPPARYRWVDLYCSVANTMMAETHLSIHPRIAVCTYNTIRLAFQQLLRDRSNGIAMLCISEIQRQKLIPEIYIQSRLNSVQ